MALKYCHPPYRRPSITAVDLGIVKIGGDDHHKIGGAEPLSLDPRALSQAAARAALHHQLKFSGSVKYTLEISEYSSVFRPVVTLSNCSL